MKVLAQFFLDDYHWDLPRDQIDGVAYHGHALAQVEMILVKLPLEFPSNKKKK